MTEKEYERQTLMVGYHGRWTPIRIVGKEIFTATNKDDGPNKFFYHVWRIYELQHGGYRVFDIFMDEHEGRQNTQLSKKMTGGEIAYHYPKLALEAVAATVFTEEQITLDADHRDLLEKEAEIQQALEYAQERGMPEDSEYFENLMIRNTDIEEKLSHYRRWH